MGEWSWRFRGRWFNCRGQKGARKVASKEARRRMKTKSKEETEKRLGCIEVSRYFDLIHI